MTVQDLIDQLTDLNAPDAEVRLMSQPSWPFEYSIRGLTCKSEIQRASEDRDEDEDEDQPEKEADEEIIYLVEGAQLCYGNKAAWNLV
jgi:hypothetical protein